MFRLKLFLPALALFWATSGWAQSLQGLVQDAATRTGIEGALVRLEKTKASDETADDGSFVLKGIPKKGEFNLIVTMDGYSSAEQTVRLGKGQKAVTIYLKKFEVEPAANGNDIPTVTLDEAEAETGDNANVASALGASRDLFQQATGFALFPFRYNPRGLEGENNLLYLNYIPLNDVETGFGGFSEFGGLNDVTRARDQAYGLEPTEYTFGGVAGGALVDTRATRQRKQMRVSYASGNAQYQHRVMGVYSTGLMPNGWAVSVAGSRRWADKLPFDGAFYDAYSWFLSVDRKFNEKHSLNLTVLGAQFERGRVGASYQESRDLGGGHFYNPSWGYQAGEKRNSSVAHQHQPIAILRHDFDISEKTKWISAASYQTGPRGGTAIDWYNAADPRPDYYRYMPFAWGFDPTRQAELGKFLTENESARQLNWDNFIHINRGNEATINDADGIAGNAVTGKQSLYIVEDRRTDSDEANFNTVVSHVINDRLTMQAGGAFQNYTGHNFKTVSDLLGGDFYLNWDKYAERDNPQDGDFFQNDLNTPNRLAKTGDRFGYDYDEHIRNGNAWAQAQVVLPKVDFFVAANVSQTEFWRVGNVRNGKFPDNSFGKGEKHLFQNFGTKGGVTFKLNGANYFYANGAYMTRAPQFQNTYLSPRTRDQIVPGAASEKVTAFEGGYLLRTPYFKGRLTGFYTTIEDQTSVRSLLINGVFGNTALTGLDEKHIGLEAALEAKLTPAFTILVAGSVGDYFYTSRPALYTVRDDNADFVGTPGELAFIENYYVRGPQDVATINFKYDLPRFTFVNLTVNYVDKIWHDISHYRRLPSVISDFDDYPVLREKILTQTSEPSVWTLDFFGTKSWKKGRHFIYLNLGVSNILDKRFVVGGFESTQYNSNLEPKDAPETASVESLGFAGKSQTNPGRTFFVQLAWRL